jgi:IPT/TIG domain
VLTYQGRLPGVACVSTLPAGSQPIRLDVPAFVGLAQRGPVSQPTAIEDINQYQTLFGGDLVLAQNGGVPVYASLPATVRSFFDNGGLRCYVVRVTGPDAVAARWLVPGLRQWSPDGTVGEVFVGAAWPGAWSAGLQVGTQLLRQPLAVTGNYQPASGNAPGTLPLSAASALAVVPGDLIQLDLGPSYPGLYLNAAAVTGPLVAAGAEIPVCLGPAVSLPGPVPVASARLLRFDLVVELVPPGGGPGQQLEQWLNLSFNSPGNPTGPTYWLNVTQQAAAPDLSRSLLLRADPAAQPLFVPPAADGLGTSVEFTDAAAGSPPYPGTMDGDDDLSSFDPVALFLDPRLAQTGVYDLIADASQCTVLSSDPVQLSGIHSLIGVDEVAMISVPDATQLGWTWVPTPATPPATSSSAPIPSLPNWSRFRSCAAPVPTPVVTAIAPASGPATGGTAVTVTGSGLAGGTVAFGGTLAAGASCDDTSCTATSPPGTGTVDVTVTTAGGTSAVGPAGQFTYQATLPPYPMQNDPASYHPAGLLAVQVALVQLCAARADAVALLSLPAHYGTPEFLAWYQQLTGTSQIVGAPPMTGINQITGAPLSFAAVWHPWIQVAEPTTPQLAPLRALPPDGAAVGTIAARESARGVWVAPANIPLRGVVGLTPALGQADEVSLFNAHGNLFARQPGAFTGLSAHTLSADPALLQLAVRRLLILLRKIALQRGMRYVFATDNDRFRQMVRRSFERLLTALTQLGAIVNFQVVIDSGAADLADGQLIVKLLVAPTSPVEFITVTLVRAGEGLLDVLEGWS